MTIKRILEDRAMSIYSLSKDSGVPYATCNDIVSGKARLEKCSAETVFKLANTLGVSMEDIIAPCVVKRADYENFKSTTCHRLKELGDINFIINTLESEDIRQYYKWGWYPESLYLLAMLDYVSRENNVPLCEDYDDLRQCRLDKPIYPSSVMALSAASDSDAELKSAVRTAIPEFKHFNIIEGSIRDVV